MKTPFYVFKRDNTSHPYAGFSPNGTFMEGTTVKQATQFSTVSEAIDAVSKFNFARGQKYATCNANGGEMLRLVRVQTIVGASSERYRVLPDCDKCESGETVGYVISSVLGKNPSFLTKNHDISCWTETLDNTVDVLDTIMGAAKTANRFHLLTESGFNIARVGILTVPGNTTYQETEVE